MRLDKFLSEAGIASRKEIRAMVRAGRVLVNGIVSEAGDLKIDETVDTVAVDGVQVCRKRDVVLMLHKPAGYVTSTKDPRERTVMELIPESYRKMGVYPVGRLDKETEGLLLFTNQGAFAHYIIAPKNGIEKIYYAEHEGTATQEDVQAFQEGILLKDGTKCLPAVLIPLGPGRSRVVVQEGKYHQVRRMMASRAMRVTYLRREKEGDYTLGDLPVGEIQEVAFCAEHTVSGKNDE